MPGICVTMVPSGGYVEGKLEDHGVMGSNPVVTAGLAEDEDANEATPAEHRILWRLAG